MVLRPIALTLLSALLVGCAHLTPEPPRGKAFWLALREAKFVPPAGVTREALLGEAPALVDAPDPLLRDEVGYGLVTAWVYREQAVPGPAVASYAAELQRRLLLRPGPVLGRSFAALSLSIVAASELKQPVLSQAQFDGLVEAGATALDQEDDLRGYEPAVGWLHATAHTADLLKFLARDPRLSLAQQDRLWGAVFARLGRGPAFTWGEDERLAGVFRSLLMRDDARAALFEAWLKTLPPAWTALWAAPTLEVPRYLRLGNTRLTLRALHVLLAGTPPSPALDSARAQVLEALLAMQ